MRNRMAMTCVMLGLALTFTKTNSVWAANASPNPDFVDPLNKEKPPTEAEKARAASVDIAPQPPAVPSTARQIGYFHKYRSGISALVFGGFDSKEFADGNTPIVSRVSLLYLFPNEKLHTYEAGVDLQSDGSGAVGLSYRWILDRTLFRPYTKLGTAIRIDGADQFASVLRLRNYQLRGNAGFEKTISDPVSLRMDVELMLSTRSLEGLVALGAVWAW